jgi:hypothetical protein
MPKGKTWSYSDEQLLIEAYNEGKTITELIEMFPTRNKKGIYRKIEHLREEKKVGYKNLFDLKRSSYQGSSANRRKGGLKDDGWGDTSWK